MAGELSTIARPYAEAVFSRAQETGQLDQWSDMLSLLSAVVSDPQVTPLISNPKFSSEDLEQLVLDICSGHLSEEGSNLVKLLVENERLAVVPEISTLFETLKNESTGTIDVTVSSAFDIAPEQEKILADALRSRLGREVSLTSVKDPSLMGGVIIRADDLVIDGSIKGRLSKLATELGI